MKVLVVGNGGREHAIAWKLAESKDVKEVVCVPGNGGTAYEDKCVNIAPEGGNYVEIARREGCSLAVIGPENPLAEGLADEFWAAGIPAVGPKKAAAQLEASKGFAKDFMKKYSVAAAESETFTDEAKALEYIRQKGAPIVVKADGLAAGKGVVVAKTVEEAEAAVRDMMEDKKFGESGSKLVIEDYLTGNEVSILAAVSVTPELAAAGKETPFYGTETAPVFAEGGVGAFLASIHDRGDEVAVPVDGEEAFLFRLGPSPGAHQGREGAIVFLQLAGLMFLKRRTAVSDDAAGALAGLIVAGEPLGKDILADKDVPDLEDRSEPIP